MTILPSARSGLRREPGLAPIRRAEDQPETAHQPAVLPVGEVDGAEPREHVLSDVRPPPRRVRPALLEDLAGRSDGPAGAVGELLEVEERVLHLDLAEVERIVAPVL